MWDVSAGSHGALDAGGLFASGSEPVNPYCLIEL